MLPDGHSIQKGCKTSLTVNTYTDVMFSIICLCRLIYNIKHVFEICAISMCLSRAHQWPMDASMTRCSMFKHGRAVIIYRTDVSSNDRTDNWTKTNLSNKNAC